MNPSQKTTTKALAANALTITNGTFNLDPAVEILDARI
jgi:hypothetical protein